MKKIHKNILSKTTLKSINCSRYNKVIRTKPVEDIKKEYIIRRDGWRRKNV